MKHNWEYKRLGDICELYQPKTISTSELTKDGEHDVFGANGIIGKYSAYNHEFPEILLTCRGATCGTINVSNPKSWINGNAMVIHSKSKCLLFDYLRYAMSSLDYSNIITGAAQPQITRQSLTPTCIPVPPMEVQEQIVAELDKINEVIEDCRELLRNLDALAQSLFYDYFGDPIANPKGFELKKLGDIDEITSAKRVLVQDVVDNGIPFIRGTELAYLSKQNSFDPSVFTMFITPEHYERVKSITGVPKLHDLLIPSINADGYIWEINTPEPLYFKDGRVLWVHVNHEVHSSKWLKFALSKIIKEKYAYLSRGAVFAELTLVFLRNLDIIVPPRSLQEKFAIQVEQIEAQKKRVEETIANLQTLLDSRMDYWFN